MVEVNKEGKAVMRREPNTERGAVHFIFHGDARDSITKESKRVIRAILTVLEEHTNFETLDEFPKKLVRSTILDSVNNLKRISMMYFKE